MPCEQGNFNCGKKKTTNLLNEINSYPNKFEACALSKLKYFIV